MLRIEQLYPFPLKALVKELTRFKRAEIVWCQEEPKNMGPWSFVEPYIEWVLGQVGGKSKRPRYAGRPAMAATATGLVSKHLAAAQGVPRRMFRRVTHAVFPVAKLIPRRLAASTAVREADAGA